MFTIVSRLDVKNLLPSSLLKSIHFKKTVARILFLSKLWYFLFWFVLKVPQFWKKWDSPNWLLKMNRLQNCGSFNTNQNKKYHNFERTENRPTVFLKWTDFRRNRQIYFFQCSDFFGRNSQEYSDLKCAWLCWCM